MSIETGVVFFGTFDVIESFFCVVVIEKLAIEIAPVFASSSCRRGRECLLMVLAFSVRLYYPHVALLVVMI